MCAVTRGPQQSPDPLAKPAHGSAAVDMSSLVIEMTKNMFIVLYVLVMIGVVVSVDILFFRNRFWERLMANIGIVLVFAAFYFRLVRNP